MKATWPSTVSTTESPSTNSSLLSPSALLVPADTQDNDQRCVCFMSWRRPTTLLSQSGTPFTVSHRLAWRQHCYVSSMEGRCLICKTELVLHFAHTSFLPHPQPASGALFQGTDVHDSL